MIDGVPMVGFGLNQTVAPLTTVYYILYPVPNYVADQEFLYEDDVTQNLFLERISGEVNCYHDLAEPVEGYAALSLRPMGVEYDTVSVLEPFTIPYSGLSPEWRNLPSWWDRLYRPPLGVLGAEMFDHPWWTSCQVKPRRLIGVRKNQWPVLAVRNYDSAARLVVNYRLKAWYR